MNGARRLAVATAVVILAGCGVTRPATHTFENSRGYAKPYDAVWEDIVDYFASHNIPVKNIAKDSGVIFAEASRFEDSVADCGNPGIFRVVDTYARFNVFVSRTTASPKVSVNTEFGQMRRFGDTITKVPCNSRGVLEKAILDSVRP